MIGYLKPQKMELVMKDYLYYKMYYCSICRHLVRNNLRFYSFLTGYEGTLLAMIYNELVVRNGDVIKDRCSGLPIVKVAVLPADHEAVELGAFLCLLAFRVKFQDNLLDESGFWITSYNRLFQSHIDKSFAAQKTSYGKFNIDLDHVLSRQQELNRLENNRSISDIDIFLNCWGETFSYIMSQPFSGKIEDWQYDLLKRFFAGLGKIINLLDAMTDIHEDRKNAKFNPILRSEKSVDWDNEPDCAEAYRKYSQKLLEEKQRLLGMLPALGFRESHPIVFNILTHCLDKETEKVFKYMVQGIKNSQRLLFNCKDF